MNTLALCASCLAADVQLNLGHRSVDDTVIVTLENKSSVAVMIDAVYIEFDGRRHEQSLHQGILPHEKREFSYSITYPSMPGSYPLTSAVRYINDGKTLSMKHVAMYHYRETALLDVSCILESSGIAGSGDIILRSARPGLWRLVLPDEMTLTGSTAYSDRTVFHVKTAIPDLYCSYAVFAVAEKAVDGRQRAALVSGTLSVSPPGEDPRYMRGRVPSGVLAAVSIFFFGVWLCLPGKYKPRPPRPDKSRPARSPKKITSPQKGLKGVMYRFRYIPQALAVYPDQEMEKGTNREQMLRAIAKYSCRMFLVTGCYFILKNADSWLDFMRLNISQQTMQYLLKVAVDNLRGPNYEYFFRYFVDWYWGASLVLALPYLYYYDAETPLERDKYACLLTTLCTLGNVFKGRAPSWNYTSRLGMLTLFVKIFYIPYLTSWVINNTFHQNNLIHSFSWDLATVNAFLVALFIYIDTAVFSFGYVFEAGFLNNKIKSVEPTLLGWVVCLWCYPPLNVFSYRPFDHGLVDITRAYPGWVQPSMTCLITILWGIFAWASISLGFKGSNLTNRGIVASGPYRFVRHPAYISKTIVWVIQGIFFAQYTVGILAAFLVIYFMRAWTEERHLSLDPDYLEYEKRVKWRFIPGVL